MRLLLSLLILLGPAAAIAAEDYAALFESAVENVTWEYPEDWAYTETRQSNESIQVGRFDPSRPEAERWSLLSVDGREPTTEEIEEFLEEKDGERGFMSGDEDDEEEDDGVRTMVEPGSLQLIEETSTHWLLRFVPEADDEDEEKFLEKLSGTVRIAKDGRHLEYIDISADKPVKPAVGVKIRNFNTRFEFSRTLDEGPIVPVAFRFRIKGRAFLAVGFDEAQMVEFSDFESVGDR